ncbi:MAG: DUF1576 domain-containing protein [Bacilli bacterium]|nr:DUF1576 domain-containing protein [Bacilli bacterium]
MKKIFKTPESIIFTLLFIIILILILTTSPLTETLKGFYHILTCTSILLTDYLAIGGLSATLLNVLLTTLLNLFLLRAMKIKINGPIFACLLTIAGFSFFGKNLYNALPLYLGVYLYTKVIKANLRDYIVVFLLSSGISPIVSFILFGLSLPIFVTIFLSIFIGVLIGFILPAFNKHTIQFHQGYNLYNTGFSMGVISMIVTGILFSLNITITRETIITARYHNFLLSTIVILSIFFIGYAFYLNKNVLKKYPCLLKESGRLFSDFSTIHGKDVVSLNIGLLGVLMIILIVALKIKISGPVMGAILTVLGFGAFGKHIRNTIPVISGALLALFLTHIDLTITSTIAIIFVTGLAPLAGKYGYKAGIIAGFLHLLIVKLTLDFQGGFDLYNNGFAAGFIAAILGSLYEIFVFKREKYHKFHWDKLEEI